MNAAQSLSTLVGVSSACHALGVPRTNFYRAKKVSLNKVPCKPPLALTETERQAVLEVLHSERFIDRAPEEIYATLLDEGIYHCSIRTMYRILHSCKEVRERRKCSRHTQYAKPELLATRPNEVWSWDISKLKGPRKWSYFYLYVIIDVFSRCIVGWMIAERESACLASRLIKESCRKQSIQKEQLTIHADRGASMTSKAVAFLLADLGVTKTHSRPYTSNDNPYSEAQFKTVKYCPEFPEHFETITEARAFFRVFVRWYNHEHRHSGISLLTPIMLHSGQGEAVITKRKEILATAYKLHPARFKYKLPMPQPVPTEVWINKPKEELHDSDKVIVNSLNA